MSILVTTKPRDEVGYDCRPSEVGGEKFCIQNRRYLGNKFRLGAFISDIVDKKCGKIKSFCDIFAGTGVVGHIFNDKHISVISNDILYSNYIALNTFLGLTYIDLGKLESKICYLNSMRPLSDNYFSINFGNKYFTSDNAKKIGAIREEIDEIADSEAEKFALITSLIYAADKIANTVGHYDAFREKMDMVRSLHLLVPHVNIKNNGNNKIYNEDANELIKRISCDVLYLDPPYNSRQYCDAYHLLENLAMWEKPILYGKARKMDRTHLKSAYCLKDAHMALSDLIKYAKCGHLLVSYNNTGDSRNGRSNARIKDVDIVRMLKEKGSVEIFEYAYKAFSAGKSGVRGNVERIFYCQVRR